MLKEEFEIGEEFKQISIVIFTLVHEIVQDDNK